MSAKDIRTLLLGRTVQSILGLIIEDIDIESFVSTAVGIKEPPISAKVLLSGE